MKRAGALSSVPPRRFAAPAEQRKSRAKAAQLRPGPRSSSCSLSQIFSLCFFVFVFVFGTVFLPSMSPRCVRLSGVAGRSGALGPGGFQPFSPRLFPPSQISAAPDRPPSLFFSPPVCALGVGISFFLSFFLFISLFIASRLFFNRKFRPFPRRSRFLSLSLFAGNRRYLSSFSR